MHFFKKAILLSLMASTSFLGYSQGEFSSGIQIRPRFEFRNGFKRPMLDNQDPAAFVEQRSRLWADYKSEKFRVHITFQDVRMWGMTNQIYKAPQEQSLTNIFEAYGIFNFTPKISIKVGRQDIKYDYDRFFGGLDWAQQGRSHDAILLRYQDEESKLKIHLGYALNQSQFEPSYLNGSFYTNNNYKNMQYIWANKAWEKLNVSVLFQNDGRLSAADTSVYYRQTIGLVPTYNTGKIKVIGEFYYQMGQNGAQQDVSAYFLALNATYKTDLTPITLGFEYASGTALDSTNNEDNSWNPLYGTNHAHYGFMDYFYVGNYHGQASGRTTGLIDIYLKTKFKLADKHFISLHAHQFLSPVDIYDNVDITQTLSTTLGTEIDVVYQANLYEGIVANIGYSQMFATESMENIKYNPVPNNVSSNNYWAWAMINFNLEVFRFKK